MTTSAWGFTPHPLQPINGPQPTTNQPDPLLLLAQLDKHMRELETKGGHITDGKFHLNP